MRFAKHSTMFLGLALAVAGCQSNHKDETAEAETAEKQPTTQPDFWAPDGGARGVWQALDNQAAAGARADATMRPVHFDGSSLNSLGTSRLQLMLGGDIKPDAVYVNLPADDARTAARRAAVAQWMEDAGVSTATVAIKDGSNPSNMHPAAPDLDRMWKTEGPGPVAAGTEDDTSGLSPTQGTNTGSSGGNQ